MRKILAVLFVLLLSENGWAANSATQTASCTVTGYKSGGPFFPWIRYPKKFSSSALGREDACKLAMKECRSELPAIFCSIDPANMESTFVTREWALAANGSNQFTLDVFKNLGAKEENIVVSPFSMSTAFAMLSGGAKGQTAAELNTTMHFPESGEGIHQSFASLQQSILGAGEERPFELITANQLWGEKTFSFLPAYLRLLKTSYGAGLMSMDFLNAPEPSRQQINAWVEEKTRGKIKDLIPSGHILPDTKLVLTNAVYMKAPWAKPFSDRNTVPQRFHLSEDKTVNTPMMNGKQTLRYHETSALRYAELPYDGGRLSMFIILPKESYELAGVVQQMVMDQLQSLHEAAERGLYEVAMPKFKAETNVQLKGLMSELGASRIFSGDADFSGISTERGLAVSEAIHKAYIKVDEKGTEAAAATGLMMRSTALEDPVGTFKVDRPFLYGIRDDATNTILFIGQVTDPTR